MNYSQSKTKTEMAITKPKRWGERAEFTHFFLISPLYSLIILCLFPCYWGLFLFLLKFIEPSWRSLCAFGLKSLPLILYLIIKAKAKCQAAYHNSELCFLFIYMYIVCGCNVLISYHVIEKLYDYLYIITFLFGLQSWILELL